MAHHAMRLGSTVAAEKLVRPVRCSVGPERIRPEADLDEHDLLEEAKPKLLGGKAPRVQGLVRFTHLKMVPWMVP